MRLNEDTFSIQIRDDEGRLQSLLKRDLKDVELIRRSPMPSFKGKLSDAQIDDVIAWLVSMGGTMKCLRVSAAWLGVAVTAARAGRRPSGCAIPRANRRTG